MNNSDYDIIMRTLKNEGGYSNNIKDKGGETYCGISRTANPTWLGWISLDKTKDKQQAYNAGFLYNEVVAFYQTKYFSTMGLSQITNPNIRACVFDFCVNSGGAVKVIQDLLNTKYGIKIPKDGIFGKQTAYILNTIPNQIQLNNDIVDARKQYVQSLVKTGNLSPIFLSGILKRADAYRLSIIPSLLDEILNFIKRLFS